MIYNTVRDNKYLEGAIGVFDSRYETAGEAVEESKDKLKYYRPPKNKNIEQDAKGFVDKPAQESTDNSDMETLTQKVADYMQKHNITDLEAFLSAMAKKDESQM